MPVNASDFAKNTKTDALTHDFARRRSSATIEKLYCISLRRTRACFRIRPAETVGIAYPDILYRFDLIQILLLGMDDIPNADTVLEIQEALAYNVFRPAPILTKVPSSTSLFNADSTEELPRLGHPISTSCFENLPRRSLT